MTPRYDPDLTLCEVCGAEPMELCVSTADYTMLLARPHPGRSPFSGAPYSPRGLLACERCKAGPSEPCTGRTGAELRRPHAGRLAGDPLVRAKRASAAKRGITWELTHDHARALMAMPCTYCGGDGSGIDRWDSLGAYTVANAVPCCATCNLMKHAHSIPAWVSHMRKILAHMRG